MVKKKVKSPVLAEERKIDIINNVIVRRLGNMNNPNEEDNMNDIDLDIDVAALAATAAQLDALYNFSTSVGWNLTFDLNLYQMISNGVWNSSNAKTLLDYASSKGYYLSFELRNEPANYLQYRGEFIIGGIIAAAYKSLHSLLSSYPIYANGLLFGTSDSASPWCIKFQLYPILALSAMEEQDYWLSVLYKRVVGQNVYNVSSASPSDPNLRLYAHSTSAFYGYGSNAVVVFGERLTSSSATLNVPQFSDKTAYLYVLTSPGGDLTSKSTSLNGNTLAWTPGQNIPDFTAQQTTFPVKIPGYSQFFIVLKN
uniref:Uncharacterized protein n=1 Tax=Acrobeloides nanus TaxID=290746 RepID=A0A914EBV2_9BILA